ncbi:MAG TPA: hypothetical protein VFG31_02900 [Conexibacter sp.]|nr:hypothetical protein [Conexibacter sp.]
MARRTINLSDSVETIAREAAERGESFSATVSRLIVQGAQSTRGPKPPRYVGAGDGPSGLGRAAERYLKTLISAR